MRVPGVTSHVVAGKPPCSILQYSWQLQRPTRDRDHGGSPGGLLVPWQNLDHSTLCISDWPSISRMWLTVSPRVGLLRKCVSYFSHLHIQLTFSVVVVVLEREG